MMMFFNPDITEPTLKPIASNESNSSEKPAQTNITKTTENQEIMKIKKIDALLNIVTGKQIGRAHV